MATQRAEVDTWYDVAPTLGHASSHTDDDDHEAHSFLYLPDISSQTGWAAHRVPERRDKRETLGRGRTVGFGRPGGR